MYMETGNCRGVPNVCESGNVGDRGRPGHGGDAEALKYVLYRLHVQSWLNLHDFRLYSVFTFCLCQTDFYYH